MTDKLRTLMTERAETATFAPPDVAVLTRAGDRRRHRRTLSVVAGVAALAVVGTVGVTTLVTDDEHESSRLPVADPAAAAPLDTDGYSWATGSVLHTATGTIDVGHPIRAYVRTSVGYVFSDGRGDVYAVAGSGVRAVGHVSGPGHRLVSDPRGTLTAWVDATGARPAFVVLDQATGEVVVDDSHTSAEMSLLADDADPAFVYAVDGTTVYRRDDRGAVAVDTDSGAVRVVDASAATGFVISGAGGGVLAFATDDGTSIGADPGSAEPVDLNASDVLFSPSGHFASADADSVEAIDLSDGSRVDFGLDRPFAAALQWLSDDTMVALATRSEDEDAVVELLTCSVPAGECRTVVDSIGTLADLEAGRTVLAYGEAVD